MKLVGKFFLTALLLMVAWSAFLVYDLASCQWTRPHAKLKFLLIGDPQIEGNIEGVERTDLAREITKLNDIYMKFIVETMVNKLEPDYTVVMGDLFSYQGTTDDEFAERAERYRWIFNAAISRGNIINITGNHDLGYGYELSRWHVNRFEAEFGLSNFDFHFPLGDDLNSDGVPDTAFISVINNLVLDPSRDELIREEVWNYVKRLNPIRLQDLYRPMVMFAHVPLYKQTGCVDKPHTLNDHMGHVIHQNHLSFDSTRQLLDKVSPDVILTGHDHHGCNYKHQNSAGRVVQEYTVRSIMGDFSGTGALLEIYEHEGRWTHSYKYCHFAPFRYITTSVIFFLILLFMTIVYFFSTTCVPALCCCRAQAPLPAKPKETPFQTEKST